MKFLQRLFSFEQQLLIQIACLSTLGGLFFMVLPLFVSSPLLLIAGMSLGHLLGLTAILIFAVTVLQEVAKASSSIRLSRAGKPSSIEASSSAASDGQSENDQSEDGKKKVTSPST